MTEPIQSGLLGADKIAHGFFTRQGGVSTGLYATLNGGVGSKDAAEAVAENRRRMAQHLGVAHLLVPFQIHSPDAMIVEKPFTHEERPRCDALVTRTRGHRPRRDGRRLRHRALRRRRARKSSPPPMPAGKAR